MENQVLNFKASICNFKASICNGEQVAGFKDVHTGKIEEIMLIKNQADRDVFRKMYGIYGKIEKEY